MKPSQALLRLARELREYYLWILFIFATGLLISLGQTALAGLLKTLMDSLTSPSLESLYQSALYVISLATLMAGLRYVHLVATDTLIEKFIIKLRLGLQKKLFQNPDLILLEGATGSGATLSRIFNDLTIVQNGLRYSVDLIREPFTFLFLLGWLLYLNTSLTLSIFFMLPLLFFFIKKITQSVAKYSRLSQQKMENLVQTIKENLDGVRVIQMFNYQKQALKSLQTTFDEFLAFRKKMIRRIHMVSPLSEWIAMIVGLFVILQIAQEIAQDRATYGDFASYVGALLLLNRPIKAVQDSVVRIQDSAVAASRLFEIMDQPDHEEKRNLEGLPFPKSFQKISFRKVSLLRNKKEVLKEVELTITRGEKIALVGPSGSGKSSLINILCGLTKPTSGEVCFDQINLEQIKPVELRSNISLVNQDVFLFSMSIQDNLLLGNPQADKVTLAQWLDKVGLSYLLSKDQFRFFDSAGERGGFLSGGEKQRISLVRAFLKDAPIMIFDEATSQLDPENDEKIANLIVNLSREKTVIVVAHRLTHARYCDRIAVMGEGRIIETGSHDQLIEKNGAYSALWRKYVSETEKVS